MLLPAQTHPAGKQGNLPQKCKKSNPGNNRPVAVPIASCEPSSHALTHCYPSKKNKKVISLYIILVYLYFSVIRVLPPLWSLGPTMRRLQSGDCGCYRHLWSCGRLRQGKGRAICDRHAPLRTIQRGSVVRPWPFTFPKISLLWVQCGSSSISQ